MVVAYTGIATVQSNSAPIANVVTRLIEPFISLCHCRVEKKGRIAFYVKRHWEIIPVNLNKAGWVWDYLSFVDFWGRT
jgi:hypothetical protein